MSRQSSGCVLVEIPLINAESFQVVYYGTGREYKVLITALLYLNNGRRICGFANVTTAGKGR